MQSIEMDLLSEFIGTTDACSAGQRVARNMAYGYFGGSIDYMVEAEHLIACPEQFKTLACQFGISSSYEFFPNDVKEELVAINRRFQDCVIQREKTTNPSPSSGINHHLPHMTAQM